MNDDRDRRPPSEEPSTRSEGDAAEDFSPEERPERERFGFGFSEKYTPRHRAPGRASLIRRRRGKDGDSEIVSWETTWPEERKQSPAAEPEPEATTGSEGGYLDATRREIKKEREEEAQDAPSPAERLSSHLQQMATPPANQVPVAAREDGSTEATGQDVTAEDAAPVAPSPTDPPVPPQPVAPDQITALLEQAAAKLEQAGTVPSPQPQEPKPVPSAAPSPTDGPIAPAPGAPAQVAPPQAGDERDAPGEPTPVPRPLARPSRSSVEAVRERVLTPVPAPAPDVPLPRPASRPLPDRTIVSGSTASRRAALRERRKKRRVRRTAGGVGALLVAILVVVVAGVAVRNVVEPDKERDELPAGPAAAQGPGGTTLFFGTKEGSANDRGAIWMTLLSLDASGERGSIVYVPPHTGVEVPGRGLQGVGEAYASGGIPLLLVSAENLFGINIDRYVELSDRDALVLFEEMETLTVDVPAEVRVPAGRGGDQARLVFVEGPQRLSPNLLVRLLYTLGIGGDDLELGSRHLAFWDALFTEYEDGEELGEVFRSAGATLGESDASPKQHAEFLSALADLPSEDLTLTTLPVRPISAAATQLYATDEEELAAFVEETIGVESDTEPDVRVQILNGNGVPGIGQDVAKKLVGQGFRIILSGNAQRLDYRETLIITYENSERGIALAERAKDLIGVGEVQISAQEQGIVDLTIVVGKDFLRAP
jgi:polyisoprenyl-teichoic acid--peptidoglycan teichoic acid transferase